MGLSLSKLQNAAFLNLASGNSSLQAQQYAAMESERLRATNYADLASKNKTRIPDSDYYSEVAVSAESDYDDTTKQKKCTINIYKADDILPRCTVKVVRINKESPANAGIPSGTIIPWYGNINDIPNGFALCNGQNGTPDLRDRFLVGAGNNYGLGAKGGEATHKLVGAELPKSNFNNSGWLVSGVYIGSSLFGNSSGVFMSNWDGTSSGGMSRFSSNTLFYAMDDKDSGFILNSLRNVLNFGNDQPHENRPPYFAVYYLMKL